MNNNQIELHTMKTILQNLTSNQTLVSAARSWVSECQWAEEYDESDIAELSDFQILLGVHRNFFGGIQAFIETL